MIEENSTFWINNTYKYSEECNNISVDTRLKMLYNHDSDNIYIISKDNNTCGRVPNNLIENYLCKINTHDLKVIKKETIGDKVNLKVISKIRKKNNVLVLDLETTGLPKTKGFGNYYSYKDVSKYDPCRTVQISFLLHDVKKKSTTEYNYIVKPDNFEINNSEFHGITQEMALTDGIELNNVADILESVIDNNKITYIIGHNLVFDMNVLMSDLYRIGRNKLIKKLKRLTMFCTMEQSKDILQLKPFIYGEYKNPKLIELCEYVLGESPTDLHNSLNDCKYTLRCYLDLFIYKNINKDNGISLMI